MALPNKHISENSSFKSVLRPTVRKALIEFWGNEKIISRPEIIADLGAASVNRINRIGRISLGEIAEALHTFGYIDSLGVWLRKVK